MSNGYHFWVYIIASDQRLLYIGLTNNLPRRLDEHKSGLIKSSYAVIHNCTKLVYYEHFSNIWRAIEREKQLKKWRRNKKLWLIETVNPEWE